MQSRMTSCQKHGSFKLDSTQQLRCRGGKLETWTGDEALEVKLADSVAAASGRSGKNTRRAESSTRRSSRCQGQRRRTRPCQVPHVEELAAGGERVSSSVWDSAQTS